MSDDSLDAIYAEIPVIRCKRKCAAACGPVVQMGMMGTREMVRLQLFEPRPDVADPLRCTLLDHATELCRAYEMRPLICRLWGVVDSPLMRCPHGCEPDRWLTDDESRALLARADALT